MNTMWTFATRGSAFHQTSPLDQRTLVQFNIGLPEMVPSPGALRVASEESSIIIVAFPLQLHWPYEGVTREQAAIEPDTRTTPLLRQPRPRSAAWRSWKAKFLEDNLNHIPDRGQMRQGAAEGGASGRMGCALGSLKADVSMVEDSLNDREWWSPPVECIFLRCFAMPISEAP